jgi:hypothetical protein
VYMQERDYRRTHRKIKSNVIAEAYEHNGRPPN